MWPGDGVYRSMARWRANPSLIGHLASVDVKHQESKGELTCEPVWPSGKAVGWSADGPRFDTRFGSPFSSKRLWFVDTVL